MKLKKKLNKIRFEASLRHLTDTDINMLLPLALVLRAKDRGAQPARIVEDQGRTWLIYDLSSVWAK